MPDPRVQASPGGIAPRELNINIKTKSAQSHKGNGVQEREAGLRDKGQGPQEQAEGEDQGHHLHHQGADSKEQADQPNTNPDGHQEQEGEER